MSSGSSVEVARSVCSTRTCELRTLGRAEELPALDAAGRDWRLYCSPNATLRRDPRRMNVLEQNCCFARRRPFSDDQRALWDKASSSGQREFLKAWRNDAGGHSSRPPLRCDSRHPDWRRCLEISSQPKSAGNARLPFVGLGRRRVDESQGPVRPAILRRVVYSPSRSASPWIFGNPGSHCTVRVAAVQRALSPCCCAALGIASGVRSRDKQQRRLGEGRKTCAARSPRAGVPTRLSPSHGGARLAGLRSSRETGCRMRSGRAVCRRTMVNSRPETETAAGLLGADRFLLLLGSRRAGTARRAGG